jgi:hypothetical protein
MTHWTFYPVFVATIVSIFGLTRLALRNHDPAYPRTLSQLAAAEQALLVRFRSILLFCGVLFATTVFGFIVPRVDYAWLVALFGALMIGGELLAAVVPARGNTVRVHSSAAQVMAIGMLGLPFLFWFGLPGVYSSLELALGLAMSLLAVLTLVDKRRFVAYELVFIFASHFSILIAALAFW